MFRRTVVLGMALALVAAGLAMASGTKEAKKKKGPIVIGASLSLSGDFSSSGQGFKRGYTLWANYINSHGGLLGRKVKLDIVSDASSPDQVQSNYQKLITVDKVPLIFGPFSTLLTKPASVVANRYGYAMVEGAGGGPSVFTRGLKNVFDVALPVVRNLDSYTNWINSLPANLKPKTAAYATMNGPFTEPQIVRARKRLQADGVKTVSYQVFPTETTDYNPIADKIIASHAQIVIAGTLLPSISAFIQRFVQEHYNPESIVATSGPDAGANFLKAIGGKQHADGVMVPNAWYPSLKAPGNASFVNAYVKKYGGSASDINANAAEGFSVGQVVAQAVEKVGSLNNKKIIKELHSGATFHSIEGPVKFDSVGRNVALKSYIFQWQNGSYIPVYPQKVAKAKPEFPKPNW